MSYSQGHKVCDCGLYDAPEFLEDVADCDLAYLKASLAIETQR